jgi:general secretion pathway protein F
LDGAQGRLSGAEAAELSQQIGGLTRSGLPLGPGLRAMGEELPRGRLRRSMVELAQTLEDGVALESAIEHQKENIPPHLRGLVIAGLHSGRLGDILARFSGYVSVGMELNRKLWLSLAYPAVAAGASCALFLFISAVVIPQFESIYLDFNIPLPFMTIAVISMSRVLRTLWQPVAMIVAGMFVAWLAARLVLSTAVRRGLAARLPLLGAVWRTMAMAEFCHLLALLLESRLPLPEALRLTGEGVQDADLLDSCRRMADQVESGRSLAEAMAGRRRFHSGLPRLLRWAEKEMSLPDVLHMAGTMYEARAKAQATFLGAVLRVLCVFLVLSMMSIVPALFIPLITLISKLSG